MIDSATFNNLKARVKAECKRRKYTGSVESYGGSAYDYTNPASAGKIVRYEHYTKIADPLSAIDGVTRKPRTRINQADITEMQNTLTTLEGKSLTTTSTGCNASCTGLCYTVCTGSCKGSCGDGCTGCTGCGDSCAYWCGAGCDGSCSGCGDSCGTSCGTLCSQACGTGCSDTCTAACASWCGGSCGNTCAYVSR